MNFTFVFCVLLTLWCSVTAKCVMYGVCAVVGGHPKLCPVDHEAAPLLRNLTGEIKNEVRDIVESRCPQLLYDDEGNRRDDDDVLSCCDSEQIMDTHRSLLLADGILGRCPTCFANFKRQICEMNCSPDQSLFVDVTEDLTPDGTRYVSEIDFRMHEEFMVNAHASCAGVIVPQTGMPAINLMCGNAPVCDPEAWFGFTGDTSTNPMAPVQVNFHRWPTTEDSMSVSAPLCNETIEGDLPCSCVDCFANCPVTDAPTEPDICTVLSVNCISFSVGIVFFVITFIIFTVLSFFEYRKIRNNTIENADIKYKYNVNFLIKLFQKCFKKIGQFSANNPILLIMFTTWISFAMFFGFLNLKLTANPRELWSAPDSRSRQELNYFNSRFGPFYRAAQVFLTIKGLDPIVFDNVTYGPAFRLEAVKELVALENAIINIGREDDTVKLEDVCYAPLRTPGQEPNFENCVSMSVSTYLPDRNNINNNTYLTSITNCLNNYYSLSCMASWGGGADPELTLGGYEGDNMLLADTLVINYPIANYLYSDQLEPVLEWEKKFVDLMHDYENNWKSEFVEVAYGSERSIEDEIERISEAEATPIIISYLIMFVYVILALGNIRSLKTCMIDSKVTVSISCIIVVIIAIFCALGLLGYCGITISLLAINVIPFFVLSVGIDNVFLMVKELQEIENSLQKYEDYKEEWSFEKKRYFVFGKMMQNVGPSIFVSSATQITCFAIGTISIQPAVQSFAIFATFSLAFLFFFQITVVVAILSLDYKRVNYNRFDVVFCVQKKILNDEDPLHGHKPYQSITQRLMEPYSLFILNWRVKIIVVIVFLALFSISVILIPQIELGLDQEMALPTDSYVYKYLQAVNRLLKLGPPVYFVLKSGLNFTDHDHQNVLCGSRLCNNDSLVTQIYLASLYSNVTYIERSSNSWIDDFFDWTSLPGSCCKYNVTNGELCQSSDISPQCRDCDIERSNFANGLRPAGEAFGKYIPFFLQDVPTESCNKGGLASYFSNVNYILDSNGQATVYDSNFMAYHSNLVTSHDYITAVKYAYELSANITAAINKHTGLDVEVFPYSVFYVYYEQYLSMWEETFKSLGFSLLGVLFINLFMTGFNFLITFALTFTVIMITIEMMGVMYIWSIPLNAVSCVNLIVSIGIAVEFCTHIAYAYATSESPPSKKVSDAIKSVGATIITGITFTNIPIIVLAFSYTQIIEVFFFRMLFSLVVLGFIHGIIFFPVLLSYLNDIKYM
ncbi:NPC intracellular cholesterol transporter 1 homolog 1b-like [Melitaea cinxia]|uniref:NPC intracellular cholesterol transporter 1 homolog 1b-like n=1 Tax=Melitaea cinxia TaxID=113334 RepID=UPI001E26FE20|nr:NPC intracellular cholesterol transporter 1 homolog 1b-like [Melitaea cinxia]